MHRIAAVVAALAVVASACAADDVSTPIPHDENFPDPGPLEQVVVIVDPTLEISPTAAVFLGWQPSPWRASTAGGLVTLSTNYLVGEEDSETIRLVLGGGGSDVYFEGGNVARTNWPDEGTSSPILDGSLTLSQFDPDGVIAGRFEGVRSFDFWVDAAAPEPEHIIDEVIVLPFGGLISFGGGYVQFTEVLDDSRCPEDVVCVWEGGLSFGFTVFIDDVATEHSTEGIAFLEGGVAFGNRPSFTFNRFAHEYELTVVGMNDVPGSYELLVRLEQLS